MLTLQEMTTQECWRRLGTEGMGRVGFDRGIQGNLDPLLLCAPVEVAKKRASAILDQIGGRPGHIFNLGHGVLPELDPGILKAVVDLVHEEGRADGASGG